MIPENKPQCGRRLAYLSFDSPPKPSKKMKSSCKTPSKTTKQGNLSSSTTTIQHNTFNVFGGSTRMLGCITYLV